MGAMKELYTITIEGLEEGTRQKFIENCQSMARNLQVGAPHVKKWGELKVGDMVDSWVVLGHSTDKYLHLNMAVDALTNRYWKVTKCYTARDAIYIKFAQLQIDEGTLHTFDFNTNTLVRLMPEDPGMTFEEIMRVVDAA